MTKIIRNKKSINAIISKIDNTENLNKLIKTLHNHPSMNGFEIFSKISTKNEYRWNENLHEFLKSKNKQNNKNLKIIALDYGVKSNILRNLYERNFEVSVLLTPQQLRKLFQKIQMVYFYLMDQVTPKHQIQMFLNY